MYPLDLRELTDAQRTEMKAFFNGLKLAELRKRQRICRSQQASAWQQLQSAIDYVIRNRLDRGLANLRIIEDMLMEAVDHVAFGDTTLAAKMEEQC